MSDERQDEEQVTASERRLLTLLQLLADGDRPDDDFSRSVMRRVRWQHGLRGTLSALGLVAVSVVDGLSLVFGLDRRRKR